jgi:flavin reductase (DIM6/NTAB) family NADH-FMN oxidoreductase RutF
MTPMTEESAPDLREAMSHLAAGVSVLATRDVVGRDCGLTVTSLASVSLDPPLCAVAVRRGGFLHDALEVADGWAVTILAANQLPLAQYAARHRYPSDTDDFARFAPSRGRISGAVYFPAGMAVLECVPHALVPAGDHTLAVGRVVSVPTGMQGVEPLIYHRRHYVGVGPVIAGRQ